METMFPASPPLVVGDVLAFEFYLGRPGYFSRPSYSPFHIGPDGVRTDALIFNGRTEHSTVPSLVASVALAGQQARLPGDVSNVVRGTGMQLVVSKTLFDRDLARQAASQVGTEFDGVEIDSMSVTSVDAGIELNMNASKTGVTVRIEGTIVGVFSEELAGTEELPGFEARLNMHPVLSVDIDTVWWVKLINVLTFTPFLGTLLNDIFIWKPLGEARQEATVTVDRTLATQFNEALAPIASALNGALELENIESRTYVSGIWFFDGNFTVAAAAFAGVHPETITAVSHDMAFVGDNLKQVISVSTISLSEGHVLKPWQAGELAKLGILDIPNHHGVENSLARGGYYLRSDPNDTITDNLVPNTLDDG